MEPVIFKRKRSDNWVEEDKTLLKDLVKERVLVIENKNTDTNSNRNKKKGWEELQESFNSLCHGSLRTIPQLKSQWTLIKIQAKKEHAVHRRQIQQTGGGPKPPDIVLGANDISVWLPQEFVIDNNKFDSDADQNISNVQTKECPQIVEILSTTNTEEHEFEENTSVYEDDVGKEPQQKITKKKRNLQVLSQNVANCNIKIIAHVEMKNRDELHLMQMENEKKRARNLDMEYKLIQENENRKARNLDLEYEILRNKKM